MGGRLGIDHVLDFELLAFVLASMGARWPALLDMEAAFPSLSQRYLSRVVRKLVVEHPVADMVADMYHGASTQLLVNGEAYDGLPISRRFGRGVRSRTHCFLWHFMASLPSWPS